MSHTIQLNANATQVDLVAGLAALKTTGGTLVLAKDSVISVSSSIQIAINEADIRIDLNGGTLQATGDFRVLIVEGVERPLSSVALAAGPNGNATLTYASLPTGLVVGSMVKVTADDALPGDNITAYDKGQTTRLGQAAEVIAINGNTVTLSGGLVDQSLYTTNVRATVYSSGAFSLENGTVKGTLVDYKMNAADLIHLRSLVEANVSNVTVQNGGYGINVVNNVNASLTDIVAKNVWAGVHSSTSTSTSVDGLFAEHVGHGVAIDGVGNAPNGKSASQYGADIALHGTNSVVYDASMSAYDYHSETRNGLYEDVLAFDSRMLAGFRGIGNGLIDSAGAGNTYGVQFFRYGNDDGRYATVENVAIRETTAYSVMISGQVLGNIVKDSQFEHYGSQATFSSTLVSLDNVSLTKMLSSSVDDTLKGSAKDDKLLGGKGADQISAAGGNDYVWGGAGRDDLNGGEGRDRFAYNALSEGGDIIRDFKAGAGGDIIDVSVLAIRMGWNRADLLGQRDIRAVQQGSDTLIQAKDGSGGLVTLAQLSNVKASDFSAANLQVKLSEPLPTVAAPAAIEKPALQVVAAPVADPLPHVAGYSFSNTDGHLKAGEKVTISVAFNEAVTVAGAGLALLLGNGATATYASGSGTTHLSFTYQVAAGDDTSALKAVSLDVSSAVVSSFSGKLATSAIAAGPAGQALVVDTTAPTSGAPTLSYVDGGIKGDGLTNARVVSIAGSGDIGSTMQVYDGAKLLGTTTVGTDRHWQFEAEALGSGAHSFTAVETDAAGNRGTTSTAAQVSIDLKAPGRATIDGAWTSTMTQSSTVQLSGSAEALASVAVYDGTTFLGTTQANARGEWSYSASGLSEGEHRFTSLATDLAGNEGRLSGYRDIVVDQTGPDIDVTRMTAVGTSGQMQLRGTASESQTTISIYDNGVFSGTTLAKYGTWIFDAKTDPTKVHTFTFTAQDRAGNLETIEGAAVFGTRGADRLAGTSHDDLLTGNGGSDVFVFKPSFGRDTISDFKAGALASGGDVIAFDPSIFSSFGAVMADAHQVGGDVVITVDSHTALTLDRTTLSSLTAQNFLFA